jgi:hypothetical protein
MREVLGYRWHVTGYGKNWRRRKRHRPRQVQEEAKVRNKRQIG